MKKLLATALLVATVASPVFADGLGEHSLYTTYDGNFGACVADKGIPLCIADWIQGQ